MQTGKLIMEHQIQNEFGVAPIVLLPPTSPAADLGGMAEPDFATQFLEQSFEPGAVTTSFQAHDHAPLELCIESSHLLFVLVLQLIKDEFASFSFQITDGLLSCMKVNADIYCVHSASFQSHVRAVRESSIHGRRRLLHNISTTRVSGWVKTPNTRVDTRTPAYAGGTDLITQVRHTANSST